MEVPGSTWKQDPLSFARVLHDKGVCYLSDEGSAAGVDDRGAGHDQILGLLRRGRLEDFQLAVAVDHDAETSVAEIDHSVADEFERMYAVELEAFSAREVLRAAREQRIVRIRHHLRL